MTTYFHGTTKADWAPHAGACLVESIEMARMFPIGAMAAATYVYTVEIDETELTVEDRTEDVDRDENCYPGDSAKSLAALAAEGVDIVTYDDETERGRQFTCVRLVNAAALAACTVTDREENEVDGR